MVYRKTIKVKLDSQEFRDITKEIEDIVEKSKIKDGVCNIFSAGSTGSIIVNENEPSLLKDIKKSLKSITSEEYEHPRNAFSHIRAAFVGSSQTIPVESGKLDLGTWQSIMIINFDESARERRVIVTVVGE